MDIKQYTAILYEFLNQLGDQDIANKQSKYMRNQFPYFGLMKSAQVKYWKEFQLEHGKINAEETIEFCKNCITYPEREMWYIGLNNLIIHKKRLQKSDLQFVKILIVKSNWWDIVDLSASHLVGELCKKHPELKTEVNEWIHHENFWLRRTALIYQLGYKDFTDYKTLYRHILLTCHEKEFFIRKAIGWVLREYSKRNPTSVREFIHNHEAKLSKLSIKEGSKYL